MLKKFRMMLAGAIAAVVVISGSNVGWMQQTEVQAATDLSQVPGYTGSPYTVVNDNEPDFAKSDFTTDAFEDYSDLDSLGRCGVAYANICKELMPTEKRGRIGMAYRQISGYHQRPVPIQPLSPYWISAGWGECK